MGNDKVFTVLLGAVTVLLFAVMVVWGFVRAVCRWVVRLRWGVFVGLVLAAAYALWVGV